ncbi:MAG: HEPN domain-containing protein [Ignavibacteria bacterium]|nr:HEPN domain-containing protein [Ignavibacteria bacterium]
MKTKEEHIEFWLAQADDDWTAVKTLYEGRNYLQSLFFAHLVIEKVCKAIWIKYNEGNVPPRTHNLNHILSTTPIELNDKRSEFMLSLNRFQLEGRYPDYLTKMYNICNESFTSHMIDEINKLKLWLQEKAR